MTTRIEKLKQLDRDSTKGPWGLTRDGDVRTSHRAENGYISEAICEFNHYRYDRLEEKQMNADFIAASRMALPELIEVVEKMREALFRIHSTQKSFGMVDPDVEEALSAFDKFNREGV